MLLVLNHFVPCLFPRIARLICNYKACVSSPPSDIKPRPLPKPSRIFSCFNNKRGETTHSSDTRPSPLVLLYLYIIHVVGIHSSGRLTIPKEIGKTTVFICIESPIGPSLASGQHINTIINHQLIQLMYFGRGWRSSHTSSK